MRRTDPERSADEAATKDSIKAATRALAEATATLKHMLATQVSDVRSEVNDAVARSLRETAESLTEVTSRVTQESSKARGRQRRQERMDQTRADLLDSASRLIAERGFGGASVADIAADAGYTKGALYAHFGSKNELFETLARERLTREAEDAEAVAAQLGADADHPVPDSWLPTSRREFLLSLEILAHGLRQPDLVDDLTELHTSTVTAIASRVEQLRAAQHQQDPAVRPAHALSDLDTAIVIVATLRQFAAAAPFHTDPIAPEGTLERIVMALIEG